MPEANFHVGDIVQHRDSGQHGKVVGIEGPCSGDAALRVEYADGRVFVELPQWMDLVERKSSFKDSAREFMADNPNTFAKLAETEQQVPERFSEVAFGTEASSEGTEGGMTLDAELSHQRETMLKTELANQGRQCRETIEMLQEENRQLTEAINRSRWIRIAGEYADETRSLKRIIAALNKAIDLGDNLQRGEREQFYSAIQKIHDTMPTVWKFHSDERGLMSAYIEEAMMRVPRRLP